MNVRKLIVLALLSALLASVLTACGGAEPSTSTEAPDETPTQIEETTPEETEAGTEAPAEVNCTFIITTQEGTPMADLDVQLVATDTLNTISLKTNAEGKCEEVILTEGKYTVAYEELPEGHLPVDTQVTIVKGTIEYALVIMDNNPNGTQERPFIITSDTTTVVIPAGATHVYMTYGAKDCEFTMTGANLTVSYKDTDYTPNEEGVINFPFVSDGPRDPAYVAFTNQTDADAEITFVIKPALGSYNNPILIENEGETVTATVPKDQTVYYKWVATGNGVAVVKITEQGDKNQIAMTNLNTSANSYFTEGTGCEYLVVSKGDEILIAVAATGSAEFTEIPFSMYVYAGTTENPLPVLKGDCVFSQAAGEIRVYSYSGDFGEATLLRIEGMGVKVTMGETVYESDENGKLEITLTPGETFVFTIENTTEVRSEIFVHIIL
ncbi:MAG: hypothetical protein E7645_01030 [Ruminococcaceae bacterium]|nr:hypothetical protein [Oscillospiraceae bacterium]